MQVFSQQIGAAQGQLAQFKQKLTALGSGSGDIDMPQFKPQTQRSKPFLKRLELGMNLQSTRSTPWFPSTTDVGVSVGYRLSDQSMLGVGGSLKIGWGQDIRHVAITGQGVGLRSFLDVKLKGSFYASGGFEYNYQKPFKPVQQLPHFDNWQQSGLLGVSKVVSIRSKVFKKTKLQLLWDFLSYEQVPRTQPIKFRVGYTF
ncbi:MAG TPA: hypothetical protein VG870_05495 [Chitinophagaceae bacterium]|nr:hypothetical protein [Chitinophagaceae bacterium]